MAVLSLLLLITTTQSFTSDFMRKRHFDGFNALSRLESGYNNRDNCDNIRCRNPHCSPHQQEYIPKNECCPKCIPKQSNNNYFTKPDWGYDKFGDIKRCELITCDIICKNNEEYWTPKDRCCPVCRQKTDNGRLIFSRGRNNLRTEEVNGFDPVDRYNLILERDGSPTAEAASRYLPPGNPVERYNALTPNGIVTPEAAERYLPPGDPVERYNALTPNGVVTPEAAARYLPPGDPAERYLPPNQEDRYMDHQGYRNGLVFFQRPKGSTREEIEDRINNEYAMY